MSDFVFTCADCGIKACRSHQLDKLPKTCPTRGAEGEKQLSRYSEEELRMSHEAALVESAGYGVHTRIEETMSFAYRMGYRRIGLAFCVGLKNEAKTIADIFRNNGFEVCAIMCKNGSIDKRNIGIEDSQQVRPGQFEPMCNPVRQAEYLNENKTDFNVLVGLCVGHDSLFFRHSEAPATVLIAKDRALAHNPVGAVYQSSAYMSRINTFIEREFGKKN